MVNLPCLHVDAGNLPVFRAGEIFDDVVKQRVNALTQDVGAHAHGNDAAVADIGTQRRTDFRFGEGLAVKIPLHHILTGFRYRFH